MKTKLFLYVILLLLVPNPLFAGSLDIEIEYYIKINPDKTQDLTVKFGVPAKLSGIGAEEHLTGNMEKLDYKVTTETTGNRHWVIATRTLSDNKFNFPYLNKLSKEAIKLKPSIANYLLFKKYSIEATYTLDEEKVNQVLKIRQYIPDFQVPFKYIIEVPGKILNHNSHAIFGNKMQWGYVVRGGENVNISFNSYEINYLNSAIALVIAGGLFFRIARKKNM